MSMKSVGKKYSGDEDQSVGGGVLTHTCGQEGLSDKMTNGAETWMK